MKKLIEKMKVFHLVMLCIAGIIIISALPFKTQYGNIYVNVATTIEEATGDTQNSSISTDQAQLFNLFERTTASGFVDNNGAEFKHDFNQYKVQVYEFQKNLNTVNDLILWYGIIALIGVAFLYIFSNNSRKVYYKSNIIVSALFTLTMVVFGVITLVKNIAVMGDFTSNSNLYNIVSVMQNTSYANAAYQYAVPDSATATPSIQYLYDSFDCNVVTFIVYDIIIIAVLAYSVFLFILSVTKYNATRERRQELEKVVALND
ncbi:MAG: hypothetical protein IKN46_01765 [Acholeplasmatales bacterium]|nr:hypothetical protein [Acholeplasmatales bacterium]MBR6288611.1 hypothetical protein [Acholeplasmatales bacterium]